VDGRIQIAAGGGRRLDVEAGGPEDGQLVIVHGGTPSAGILYPPHVAEGADRGLRQVTYSRPGYATSDRHEGRSVADCVDDVAAIADHFGAERFFTVGGSGGGPHALACAALMPDRVLAAAAVASCAPRDAEGLDWLDGMSEENLAEFGAAEAGADALTEFLEHMEREFAGITGAQLHEALGGLLSGVDRQALTGEYADYVAAGLKASISRGVWGWFDDDMAFIRDWGFDLGAIDRPVAIWQGRLDQFVPYAHGEWLAARVGGARPHLLPDQGHLSIAVSSWGEVLDDLVASAG
jgi:pimeloyl-ACP methyl ester carboxylesterase